MQTELIEHAVRVLEHADGRSMPADTLYRRISGETGLHVGLSRLLEHVRQAEDRFHLLPSPAAVLDDVGCTAGEHSLYAEALAAAGVSTAPTIMLAERPLASADTGHAPRPPSPCRPDGVGRRPRRRAPVPVVPRGTDGPDTLAERTEPASPSALLGELHGALTELLRATGGDQGLERLISGSLASLGAACRRAGEGS
jgi:hypothetical protein